MSEIPRPSEPKKHVVEIYLHPNQGKGWVKLEIPCEIWNVSESDADIMVENYLTEEKHNEDD